ncbi:hypothetical protein V6Z05_19950 [Leptospira venezuelensis]|uniref:hypothetical protein n=1 Tax=Leptospira venezuelensis TaxID=1958811 RepID=UPI000A3CAFE0|nr:hypothetical protein [Leptospira venezuelensis]
MQRSSKKVNRRKNVSDSSDILGTILMFPIILIIASPFVAYALFGVILVQKFLQIVAVASGIENVIGTYYGGMHVMLLLWITGIIGFPTLLLILKWRFIDKKLKKKEIRTYNRQLLGVFSVFALVALYTIKSYVIVTPKKIYISGIVTLFHRKEFSYHEISDLIIKATQSKSHYQLSIDLDIGDERIKLNEIGYFAAGNSIPLSENAIPLIRGIYLFLKENAPNKIKINYKYLNDNQIEYLNEITQN